MFCKLVPVLLVGLSIGMHLTVGAERPAPAVQWEAGLAHSLIDIANAIFWAQKLEKSAYIPSLEGYKYQGGLLKDIVDKTYSFGECGYLDANMKERRGTTPDYARKGVFLEYILPQLNFSPYKSNCVIKDMVIHIRGGDIWTDEYIESWYLQPPFNYYKALIEKHAKEVKTVMIITEGNVEKAPVYKKIISLLQEKGIDFIVDDQSTAEQAFTNLVHAPGIVIHSRSGFGATAALCNYYLTPSSIQYIPHYVDKIAHYRTPREEHWIMGWCPDINRVRGVLIGGKFMQLIFSMETDKGLCVKDCIKLYAQDIPMELYIP